MKKRLSVFLIADTRKVDRMNISVPQIVNHDPGLQTIGGDFYAFDVQLFRINGGGYRKPDGICR